MDDDHCSHLAEAIDRIAAALERQNEILTRIANQMPDLYEGTLTVATTPLNY